MTKVAERVQISKRVREKQLTTHLRYIKKMAIARQKGFYYEWLSTGENPEYESGLKKLPFESCLIHHKSNRIEGGKPYVLIQTKPKWLTSLLRYEYDKKTNDFLPTAVIHTNNFKQQNNRKIKALTKFCNYYQPLYEKREVTLFFLTFTKADKCRPWKEMVKVIHEYFKRSNLKIRGNIWTMEISEKLHWHYHLVIATDRANLRGGKIPKLLKFDRIWKQRTEIDFVKKNIRNYMSKYFAKSNMRIEGGGYRNYGMSKELN